MSHIGTSNLIVDLDEVPALLVMTRDEARVLRSILREQVCADLDLLEDLAYADRLAMPISDAAIERVALAVRLDVGLV